MISDPPSIRLQAIVSPVRENVVARPQDSSICFVHPGQRFVVESAGAGFALCRLQDSPQSELLCIQTSDLEVVIP